MVCGLLCCAAGLWVAKWFWVLFIDFGWFGLVNAVLGGGFIVFVACAWVIYLVCFDLVGDLLVVVTF